MKRWMIAVALSGALSVTLVPAGPAMAGGGGGGCHGRGTSGAGTAVQLVEACFGPTVLQTDPGAEVTWTNRDPMDHVVTGTGWGSGDPMTQGASVSYRFEDPGVYPYSCFYHPGMNGVVVVGDVDSALVGGPVAEPPPPPASEEPAAAPEPETAGGTMVVAERSAAGDAAWRTVALVALAMFVVTLGMLIVQRAGGRRSRMVTAEA